MANRRVLVKRRKAIQNIRKITRTMQLIATARFQAAFGRATASRPYVERLAELVADLADSMPPDAFPGFGRALLAPLNGVVVGAHDGEPDHDAFRGLRSIGYALGQRGRAARDWRALAGNGVLIEGAEGVVVAVCHLRRHRVRVVEGQTVSVGDLIGECGNSGNSTEPHVHVQAMTGRDPKTAGAEPVSFRGRLPRNGEVVRIP